MFLLPIYKELENDTVYLKYTISIRPGLNMSRRMSLEYSYEKMFFSLLDSVKKYLNL